MIENMFRAVNSAEEVETFVRWARTNYTPGNDISGIWHPLVQAECVCMNMNAAKYTGRWPVVSLP